MRVPDQLSRSVVGHVAPAIDSDQVDGTSLRIKRGQQVLCVPPAPHGKDVGMHHQLESLLLTTGRNSTDRLVLKRKSLRKRQDPQVVENHVEILALERRLSSRRQGV